MKELYTLTIELESGMYASSEWKRVIEVPEDLDLFDLHLFIQKIIGFDNDHLFEFFVGKNWRKRERVFGDEDEYGFEEREGLDTMLNEVYPITRSKLFFTLILVTHGCLQSKKGERGSMLRKASLTQR